MNLETISAVVSCSKSTSTMFGTKSWRPKQYIGSTLMVNDWKGRWPVGWECNHHKIKTRFFHFSQILHHERLVWRQFKGPRSPFPCITMRHPPASFHMPFSVQNTSTELSFLYIQTKSDCKLCISVSFIVCFWGLLMFLLIIQPLPVPGLLLRGSTFCWVEHMANRSYVR